ncbi:MAG: hypothetical protein SPI59_04755 [Finegoldia sp.]|nr:hypothetical protein [Finegoldia sp.]
MKNKLSKKEKILIAIAIVVIIFLAFILIRNIRDISKIESPMDTKTEEKADDKKDEKENKEDEAKKDEKEDKNKEEEEALSSEVAKTYAEVLKKPEQYKFPLDNPTRDMFSYSLIVLSGSDTPVLLLQETSDYGMSYVKFFNYDSANKSLIAYEDEVDVGTSPAGGYRAGVSINKDKSSLDFRYVDGAPKTGACEKISFKDNKIVREKYFEGNMDDFPKVDTEEIKWTDVDDFSALEDYGKVSFEKEMQEAKQEEKNKLDALIQAEKNKGNTVLSGTIQNLTGMEVLALQGKEQAAETFANTINETYTIFILDEPQVLEFFSPGSASGGRPMASHEVHMIQLYQIPNLKPYYSKHVVMSFIPTETAFPTGAEIPMGEPSTHTATILGVD